MGNGKFEKSIWEKYLPRWNVPNYPEEGNREMITQKDIHNILVKSDLEQKAEIIRQCDYDIDKIKEFESLIANICNASVKTVSEVSVSEVLTYMNTEIL